MVVLLDTLFCMQSTIQNPCGMWLRQGMSAKFILKFEIMHYLCGE